MACPTFYLRRGDRLIARIKHVLYGWRFARQAGGKAVVMWPPPGSWRQFDSMEYSPSLIFNLEEMALDATISDLSFVETSESLPKQRRSLRDPEFATMRNNNFDREYFKRDALVFHEDSLMQYRFSDEQRSSAVFDAELSLLFHSLKLHPAVEAGLARISAANVTNLSSDEVIRLYTEQAVATFIPSDANNGPAIDYLAERISQHYRFVNRLGTKAEIEAMDPRHFSPSDLKPIVFPGST